MSRTRSEKGAALLEAAITIPILLLISVGIFEFGRAYQTWEVVTNAAREGARVAIIAGSTDTDVRTQVNTYLSIGGLSTLADSQIVLNRNVPLAGTWTGSQVQVNYPFSFIVLNPVVRLVNSTDTTTGAPITMVANAMMRNE